MSRMDEVIRMNSLARILTKKNLSFHARLGIVLLSPTSMGQQQAEWRGSTFWDLPQGNHESPYL